jgi:hypothetical protein
VVSTEDAAFRITDSVFKTVNKKCRLEEFSVIWQRLLIVSIMKSNYISMEFEEYLKTGSGPIQLVKDRNLK